MLRSRIEAKPVGADWRIVVEGALTFLALPRLTRVLASVPERATVTVEISVNYLDHAAHQANGLVEIGQLVRRTVDDLVEPERPKAAA